MTSSISIVLLVAPVAYHRLLFRRHQLGSLCAANVMAVAGLVTVALAVTGAVLLVTSYVEPGAPTPVLAKAVGGLFAGLWFVLPLARREKAPSPDSREGDQ
jgi:hypothetical protein